MYSAKVIGPRDLIRSARIAASGVGSERKRLVLPLRIADEHFDHIVVQAVVEMLLESPGELGMLDLSRAELNRVFVNVRLRRLEANHHFHRFFRAASLEIEQRMFVFREFMAHFQEHFVFGRHDAAAPPAFISSKACWNASSASLSKSTNDTFSKDVGPSKCFATSRSMISAHSRIGNPAIPVPTAGNAIVFSFFCAAIRNECAVELRSDSALVRPPNSILAAWIT